MKLTYLRKDHSDQDMEHFSTASPNLYAPFHLGSFFFFFPLNNHYKPPSFTNNN